MECKIQWLTVALKNGTFTPEIIIISSGSSSNIIIHINNTNNMNNNNNNYNKTYYCLWVLLGLLIET